MNTFLCWPRWQEQAPAGQETVLAAQPMQSADVKVAPTGPSYLQGLVQLAASVLAACPIRYFI